MATPAVITYAYIRGKWYAFTDQESARAGVTRYGGNIKSLRTSKPVGVLVDNRTFVRRPASYWPPTLANAPGITGDALINPPVNPIHRIAPVTPEPVVAEPVVAEPVVEAVVEPSGGGGGDDSPHPPEVPSPERAPNFASYVDRNRDLAAAYRDYGNRQRSTAVDLWEKSSAQGRGRGETGPTKMSKSDWGRSHWGQYGQDESRQRTPRS